MNCCDEQQDEYRQPYNLRRLRYQRNAASKVDVELVFKNTFTRRLHCRTGTDNELTAQSGWLQRYEFAKWFRPKHPDLKILWVWMTYLLCAFITPLLHEQKRGDKLFTCSYLSVGRS